MTTKNNHNGKKRVNNNTSSNNQELNEILLSNIIYATNLKDIDFQIDTTSREDDIYNEENWDDDVLNVQFYIERDNLDYTEGQTTIKKSSIEKIQNNFFTRQNLNSVLRRSKNEALNSQLLLLYLNLIYNDIKDQSDITILILKDGTFACSYSTDILYLLGGLYHTDNIKIATGSMLWHFGQRYEKLMRENNLMEAA